MKYVLTRRVDADGILRVELELGEAEAGKAVRVTVEAVTPSETKDSSPLTDEEWRQAVKVEFPTKSGHRVNGYPACSNSCGET